MMKRLRSQHPLWMKCTTVPAHLPSAPILQKTGVRSVDVSYIAHIKNNRLDPADAACTFSADCFSCIVVPVRYRTDGSIEENIRVQGKVHWLLSYSVVWLFL